eukprot:6211880-Pleurochrysis_carterae.AAC.3
MHGARRAGVLATHLHKKCNDANDDGVKRVLHMRVVVMLEVLGDLMNALDVQHVHAAANEGLPEHLDEAKHCVSVLMEATCNALTKRMPHKRIQQAQSNAYSFRQAAFNEQGSDEVSKPSEPERCTCTKPQASAATDAIMDGQGKGRWQFINVKARIVESNHKAIRAYLHAIHILLMSNGDRHAAGIMPFNSLPPTTLLHPYPFVSLISDVEAYQLVHLPRWWRLDSHQVTEQLKHEGAGRKASLLRLCTLDNL